ncbi:unnamed protein product [Sphagnum tenellum]
MMWAYSRNFSSSSSIRIGVLQLLLVYDVKKKEISLSCGSGANADRRWSADSEDGQRGGGRERAWKTKAAAAAVAR